MRRIADWPFLFGHIVTSTGWTIAEVESLTLIQANELLEYWSQHPPAHVLLAAMFKARPLRKASQELASAVAGVGGRVSREPSSEMGKILTHNLERDST